jgi:hypothetical protein
MAAGGLSGLAEPSAIARTLAPFGPPCRRRLAASIRLQRERMEAAVPRAPAAWPA